MKWIKYIVIVGIIGLLGYNSVYVEKLSKIKKTGNKKFGASAFAKKLWDEKMSSKMDSAVGLSFLVGAIAADKEATFNRYSNALSIGNYRYALVSTSGTVTNVSEDEVILQVPLNDSSIHVIIATEYIYGNAIRDASGLVAVIDFPNSADLNNISEEMNKLAKGSVLPSFKTTVKKGDSLHVVAAIELNKEHIKWDGLELIPVRVQTVQ